MRNDNERFQLPWNTHSFPNIPPTSALCWHLFVYPEIPSDSPLGYALLSTLSCPLIPPPQYNVPSRVPPSKKPGCQTEVGVNNFHLRGQRYVLRTGRPHLIIPTPISWLQVSPPHA